MLRVLGREGTRHAAGSGRCMSLKFGDVDWDSGSIVIGLVAAMSVAAGR